MCMFYGLLGYRNHLECLTMTDHEPYPKATDFSGLVTILLLVVVVLGLLMGL